ncbi:CD1247 N-terminal domain-containing protein [Salinithrix halophila]|uniref:CD1247 N-terminal domain-containing protein n=1 Tax=Salinithrix halophila TaxID=1485204 RepID=A0ABV8JLM9_9BACL
MDVQTDRLRRDLAFIQGLMEGNQQLSNSPEGMVLNRLLTVMDQVAEENEQLHVRLTELEDYVEAVDEDLNEVELLVYDEPDWGEEEEEDIGFWEVACPECQRPVLVDEEIFEERSEADVMCPRCETVLRVSDEGEVREKGTVSEGDFRNGEVSLPQ